MLESGYFWGIIADAWNGGGRKTMRFNIEEVISALEAYA